MAGTQNERCLLILAQPWLGVKGNKIDDPVMHVSSDNGYAKEVIYLNRVSNVGKLEAGVEFGEYKDFGTIKGRADIYINGDLKKTIINPEIEVTWDGSSFQGGLKTRHATFM